MEWLEILLGARIIHVERKMDGRYLEAMIFTVARGEQAFKVTVEAHSCDGCGHHSEDSGPAYVSVNTQAVK